MSLHGDSTPHDVPVDKSNEDKLQHKRPDARKFPSDLPLVFSNIRRRTATGRTCFYQMSDKFSWCYVDVYWDDWIKVLRKSRNSVMVNHN